MRKTLHYVLLMAWLVIGCNSATASIKQANTDYKPLKVKKIMALYAHQSDSDETRSGMTQIFNHESIRLNLTLENNGNTHFKGQYGIGLVHIGNKEIQYPLIPESIVYTSNMESMVPGENRRFVIKTDPIVDLWNVSQSAPTENNNVLLFPVVKDENGNWVSLITEEDNYQKDFYSFQIWNKKCFLQDSLITSKKEVLKNETFIVRAQPVCASNPSARFEVSLYKSTKVENTHFLFDMKFIKRISYKQEGDLFYCKVPDNIPADTYEIVVTLENEAQDYGWSAISWRNRPDYVATTSDQNQYFMSLNLTVKDEIDSRPLFAERFATMYGQRGCENYDCYMTGIFNHEKVRFKIALENNRSTNFKGQYGVGVFYPNKNYDNLAERIKPEYIVYTSEMFNLAPGESIADSIKTEPIVDHWGTTSSTYRDAIALFPVAREENGEWIPLSYDINNFFRPTLHTVDIWTLEKGFFMQDNLEISHTEVNKEQEFTVRADVLCPSNPDARYQVSLYKSTKVEGTNFGVDMKFMGRLDYKKEGDLFYCKVPTNIPNDTYFIEITFENEAKDFRYSLTQFYGKVDFTAQTSDQNKYKYDVYNFTVKDGMTTDVESNKGNSISIYPNPVVDELHIDSPNGIQSVEIFDLMGKSIYKANSFGTSIPMSQYPKGIYIVRLTTENGEIVSSKIIKE